MIAVSPEFTAAILATARRLLARLVITWADPTIDPATTGTATDENYISYPEQVADLAVAATHKWASLDGVITPNGTYHPAPSQAEADSGVEMGYWGATRCNGSKVWGVNPTVTVTFDPRPVTSFFVAGDSQYSEYPVDFDIRCYDDGDVLLDTQTITANTSVQWTAAAPAGLDTVAKMVLEIKKWSHPNRVAKILEFYTTVAATYEGDEIVSVSILEEREIADGSMPVGNISSNDIEIELNNISIMGGDDVALIDPFFYGNTDSYLAEVLIPNRKIKVYLGLDTSAGTEWIPMGTFWSGDWSAPELGTTVTTSARDRMEQLRKAEFKGSEVYTDMDLYDLAEIVLNDAKTSIPMSDLTWSIDAELHDFEIPFAYFPRQDYFKCLKQIVEACMGQAFMSRTDVLTITGPSFAGNA